MDDAIKPSCRGGAVVEPVQREGAFRRVAEQPRMQELHAGEEVGRYLRRTATARHADGIAEKIARDLVAGRTRGRQTGRAPVCTHTTQAHLATRLLLQTNTP